MLSKFSVKRPYTVLVGVVLILILGVVSFMNLQTDLLPSIDLPYVVVITSYPGASPEEVEMIVTRPIEQVLATTSNIENVSSISSENMSMVILEFNNKVNMDSAIIEINSSIDLIKPNWDDNIGTPMIMKVNPDMLPIMVASVDMENMDLSEITKLVNEDIIPELESIEGVASVEGVGLVEESIEVIISSEKIESLNKKILSSIDSELSETEDKLLDAKKQIEDGLTTLEHKYKEESARLTEGEKAIKAGKEQIQSLESSLKQGEEELHKNREELEDALKTLKEKEEELLKSKAQLESMGDNLTEEQSMYLTQINEGLQTIASNKAQTEIALDTINNKIAELEDQKTALEMKRAEINVQEEQIKEGKAILEAEIEKAREELLKSQRVLNEQMEEFEKAREEAYKKASLDGVITEEMISGILAAQNFSMPAGYISDDGIDYIVKVGDRIQDIDELKKLLLFDTGTEAVGKIYLKDVADIEYKDNSKDTYAKVNGNDAIILTMQKQSNFSTAEVSDRIGERIEELIAKHDGLNITPLMDQGLYIDIVVDSILDNLVYGGLLAVLVLIVFLRDVKPTFVIALSIPISIVFAIAMMYFTGVTINIFSLGGLAMGVGMLVDNSIVVLENIYRLRNEGMSAIKASILGAKEVSGALLGSTLTTVVVFLPIVFTDGISRQLFTDMGLTIAYSLFASLIVALTLVPVISSNMLKRSRTKEHRLFNRILNIYEKALRWSLEHKAVVVVFVVVLFATSAYLGVSMGTSFIPEMESPQMSVTIELPEDSRPEVLYSMADTVMARILDIEGIKTVGAFEGGAIGGFMTQDSKDNSMTLYIIIEDEMVGENREIEKKILKATEDLNCKISVNTTAMDMATMIGPGIEVMIKGRDLDTLRQMAKDIAKILEETEGTIEVSDGIDEEAVEMRIIVDKEKAMEKGLTVAQVYGEINNKLSKGKTSTTLTVSNKDYPVIVVDGAKQSISRSDLKDLPIKINNNGQEDSIKLADIAEITEGHGLSSIRRDSQQRYISVSANIHKDYNIGLVSREFENKLKDYNIPDGYRVEISGERELIKESLTDLAYMLILAISFIYLVMVAQFQSLLSPFIVMFTIPLAFTGGLLALVITGYDISVVSMLGFLVLSGVVVNNGIVFIDYVNQLRELGISKKEALVQAGKVRIRPILMTAITTILGLSTLSVGVGMGAEVLQPLAIAAIGGLTYSTILTLFFIPAMYDLFHKDKLIKSMDQGDEQNGE